jgi:transposase
MQGQNQYQQQLFHYFDIESLIPQNHLLRKIEGCVNLDFVRNLTEDFYCSNNGRPSVDPELFFRMILIGYLNGIDSDRQLCDEIQYNLAYRWFCKLNLEDKVPDHSSLTRIRDRFGLDVFNSFFINIVEQCKEIGLVKGERIMTDGTLFEANASLNSLVPKNEDGMQNTKVSKIGVEAPASRKISNKTHISKTDPDATLAFKNGTPRTLKYKAHITIDADSRVVLDAKVTTGATHESQVYLQQIEAIENDLKLNITEAIADRAYGSGHIIQSLIEKQINPNIPLFSSRSGSRGINNETDFIYDEENNRYQCPAGHFLTPYPSASNDTIIYHSNFKDCTSCQLKIICKAKPKNSENIRIVTRHVHHKLFETMKESMGTEEFQKKMTERMWKMEGIISEAKLRNGLSRAKYRGLMKTQIQAYMVASALNMKRLMALFIFVLLYEKISKLFNLNKRKH